MRRNADRSAGSTDTATDRPGQSRLLVTSRCTLDGFVDDVADADGLGLCDLEPLTALRVRTANTVYEITVLRPPQTAVLVRGGRFFPQTSEARFSGSGFGGSCLKVAWFGVGLHMEFHYTGVRIVTSCVRSIQVLDTASLPGPF
jgi:hypothetical protein